MEGLQYNLEQVALGTHTQITNVCILKWPQNEVLGLRIQMGEE